MRERILFRLYRAMLQDPGEVLNSRRFEDLGDRDAVHSIILELARANLITHLEPITLGDIPTIQRIPGIRITATGQAVVQQILASSSQRRAM
jgi:hypothetical protein